MALVLGKEEEKNFCFFSFNTVILTLASFCFCMVYENKSRKIHVKVLVVMAIRFKVAH